MNRKLIGIAVFVVLSLGTALLLDHLVVGEDIVMIDGDCFIEVVVTGNGSIIVAGSRVTRANLESMVRDIHADNPGCNALVRLEMESEAELVVDVVSELQEMGLTVTVGDR